MPIAPPQHRPMGWKPPAQAEQERQRLVDKRRGTPAERGYGARWKKARDAFLKEHPLCRPCGQLGRLKPADTVDHIVPHKGDHRLFWDRTNWQPSCRTCHSIKTAREDGGFGNPRR